MGVLAGWSHCRTEVGNEAPEATPVMSPDPVPFQMPVPKYVAAQILSRFRRRRWVMNNCASSYGRRGVSALSAIWSGTSWCRAYTGAKYVGVLSRSYPLPADCVPGALSWASSRNQSPLVYTKYLSDCFCTGIKGANWSAM